MSESKAVVACLPVSSEAEELVARMLAGELRRHGQQVSVFSVQLLTSEYVKQVAELKPDVVCISAVPPMATLHARYMAKLLRNAYPRLKIVIGLWRTFENKTTIESRLPASLVDYVATSVHDATSRIISLAQLKAHSHWELAGAQGTRGR